MKDALKLKAQSANWRTKVKTKTKRKIGLHKALFPTFLSSIPHHKRVFKTAAKYTTCLCIVLFLFFNVLFSQFISPLYYRLMNDDRKAAVSYVQSLRDSPIFSSEYSKIKSIYGKGFDNEVFAQKIQKEIMIKNFEHILDKNPYSKDTLFSLYLLYSEKGKTKLAQEYLQKAKTIDPTLGN